MPTTSSQETETGKRQVAPQSGVDEGKGNVNAWKRNLAVAKKPACGTPKEHKPPNVRKNLFSKNKKRGEGGEGGWTLLEKSEKKQSKVEAKSWVTTFKSQGSFEKQVRRSSARGSMGWAGGQGGGGWGGKRNKTRSIIPRERTKVGGIFGGDEHQHKEKREWSPIKDSWGKHKESADSRRADRSGRTWGAPNRVQEGAWVGNPRKCKKNAEGGNRNEKRRRREKHVKRRRPGRKTRITGWLSNPLKKRPHWGVGT